MEYKNKDKLYVSSMFGALGFLCGVVAEKWGISRGKVPDTISWHEFFTERLDNVLLISVVVFALAYILHGWLKGNSTYLICVKCQTPYDKNNINNNLCPSCNVELEPLKGFYERHPEFKDGK